MEKDTKLTKQKIKLSLNAKLVLVTGISLLASTVLFFINLYIVTTVIENVYLSHSAVQRRTLDYVEDFAFYVSKNHIASSDMSAILSWQDQKKDVYILVYQNDKIIFDPTKWDKRSEDAVINKFLLTDRESGEIIESETAKRNAIRDIQTDREEDLINSPVSDEENFPDMPEHKFSDYFGHVNSMTVGTENNVEYTFYPVRFADAICDVCILDYSESGVYTVSIVVLFFISCLCCIIMIAFYNRKVIKRVVRLNREVQTIESRDINADITVNGNDELHVLADSIHHMRNTIVDQLSREKEAWQANRDLVTSMAHDIRTPLTVLSGYLELLKEREYESEEEMEQYISVSAEKAQQLKDLSDKLFLYFFVYSKTDEELNLEEFDAADLMGQLFGEYTILLEEKGFRFKIPEIRQGLKIRIDVQHLERMLDNIFTNIRKYADKEYEIVIGAEYRRRKLHITIRNAIIPNRNTAESTRIGMKTCQKIADQMGIRFWIVEKGMYYTVHLEFLIL